MRAAVMRDGAIEVDEIDIVSPGPGQVLVKTLACGICGSDLHMLQHGPRLQGVVENDPLLKNMDFKRDVVMGHEFCAEIIEFGGGSEKKLSPGAMVCSLPVLLGPGWRKTIGYSNDIPGGYSEYMILNEALLLPVPGDLPADHAALTEPMAVGVHAVAKAELAGREVPLVIGCGPVGLAVIAALKQAGAGPIIAADFSPARRRLAEVMGADEIIDPAENSPYDAWRNQALIAQDDAAIPALGPVVEKLRPAVIFECVGIPGILDQIMAGAARGARIMVVGVCMELDQFRPYRGSIKELNVQFVLGYTMAEFTDTLTLIADGKIDVAPLITGHVGLDGVAQAFKDLAAPELHAKIIVKPDIR